MADSVIAQKFGGCGGLSSILKDLSPGARGAILKARFAETIAKANGVKFETMKEDQERKKLGRRRLLGEAKIKALSRKAEIEKKEELKWKRNEEREAARKALQVVERNVEVQDNFKVMKELKLLLRYQYDPNDGSWKEPKFGAGSAWSDLGLRLKEEDNSVIVQKFGGCGGSSSILKDLSPGERGAILKAPFAETIAKANRVKFETTKEDQEHKKLERRRLLGEAKIKSLRREEEIKKKRNEKRDAARKALDEVERNVEVQDNFKVMKELNLLMRGYQYDPEDGSWKEPKFETTKENQEHKKLERRMRIKEEIEKKEELKRKRNEEREAARKALEAVERNVEVQANFKVMKELKLLMRGYQYDPEDGSWKEPKFGAGSAWSDLGLRLKEEDDEDVMSDDGGWRKKTKI